MEVIKKLAENQNKIIQKIKVFLDEFYVFKMNHDRLIEKYHELDMRVGGIETVLIDMGVKKEALTLHQSIGEPIDEELAVTPEVEKGKEYWNGTLHDKT